MHVSYSVQAFDDDGSLALTAEHAKEAFAKAVEWHVVERFFDVSISDGNKRYSIVEFSSMMALAEIAHTVKTAAEAPIPGQALITLSSQSRKRPGLRAQPREKSGPGPAAVPARPAERMHVSMLMTMDDVRCTRSAPRRWTLDEERKLDELLDAGKGASDIAVALNRTRQAVYARFQRLHRRRSRLSDLSSSG
jgi:hypothetical protein